MRIQLHDGQIIISVFVNDSVLREELSSLKKHAILRIIDVGKVRGMLMVMTKCEIMQPDYDQVIGSPKKMKKSALKKNEQVTEERIVPMQCPNCCRDLSQFGENFRLEHIQGCCRQEALKYMKNVKNMMHRDIKPANILWCTNGRVKVGDFGISRKMSDDNQAHTFLGTHLYLSPERYDPPYSYPADVYVVEFELDTSRITLPKLEEYIFDSNVLSSSNTLTRTQILNCNRNVRTFKRNSSSDRSRCACS